MNTTEGRNLPHKELTAFAMPQTAAPARQRAGSSTEHHDLPLPSDMPAL